MQRNCQGEFIFAWHCDTLCLLACNLSFCTQRHQKPLPATPYPTPPSRSQIHSASLTAGLGVRTCSVSIANQPSLAVSFDGEKSLSLLERHCRWTGGALTPVGVGGVYVHVEGRWGKWISHTSKQFVMFFQIWQEMHKQSVPLNDDNSSSSRILQGVWEFFSTSAEVWIAQLHAYVVV